ncbi:hypothetical protein SYV04_11670 [Hyalangium sp. s54d21]|uniref:HTH lysR-type domain-containing protein n=1 Tax=Hyalangium rubrum TaxID=3103134 RepID=A0ABU5H171_9BACT|nr:hypothetical protein [Hyalangium sp. s54d21]MDY7227056.1 hypothetical protein [Hyalangium sp. s54d21]
MRQLEAKLGVVLLNRTSRSVAVTDAERRLVEEAGPGLAKGTFSTFVSIWELERGHKN